jgi:hypothetical protein
LEGEVILGVHTFPPTISSNSKSNAFTYLGSNVIFLPNSTLTDEYPFLPPFLFIEGNSISEYSLKAEGKVYFLLDGNYKLFTGDLIKDDLDLFVTDYRPPSDSNS